MSKIWKIIAGIGTVLGFIFAALTLKGTREKRKRLRAESALANSALAKAKEDAKKDEDKKRAEIIEDVTTSHESGVDRLLRRHAKASAASGSDSKDDPKR